MPVGKKGDIMSRNLAKEAAWEKENYTQFKFRLKKGKADAFKDALATISGTQSEWFNMAVEQVIIMAETFKKLNTPETSKTSCVLCGTPNETGYQDGFFRCLNCDHGHYESVDDEADDEKNQID